MPKHPDIMSKEMALLNESAPYGSLWRHLKTATDYMVVGHCFLETDASPATLYAHIGEGEHPIWARAASEFLDGRFERLPTP